jgi:TRAP-type C4-dicarboxylate transport system permease small subunit
VQKLPLGARAWLHFVALAVLLVVAGFFAWGAAALTLDSWQLRATDVSQLSTPLVVPQALWAAGLSLFLLAALGLAARTLRALVAGRPAEVERVLAPRHYDEEVAETLEVTRTDR